MPAPPVGSQQSGSSGCSPSTLHSDGRGPPEWPRAGPPTVHTRPASVTRENKLPAKIHTQMQRPLQAGGNTSAHLRSLSWAAGPPPSLSVSQRAFPVTDVVGITDQCPSFLRTPPFLPVFFLAPKKEVLQNCSSRKSE